MYTYNGETHEAGEQEEVVVQVTVIQVSGHPLVAWWKRFSVFECVLELKLQEIVTVYDCRGSDTDTTTAHGKKTNSET